MIAQLGYYLILGKPLIFYLGILTYLSFSLTALVGYLNFKGIRNFIPFRWHPRLAVFSLSLGMIHAIFGLALYFNFNFAGKGIKINAGAIVRAIVKNKREEVRLEL